MLHMAKEEITSRDHGLKYHYIKSASLLTGPRGLQNITYQGPHETCKISRAAKSK